MCILYDRRLTQLRIAWQMPVTDEILESFYLLVYFYQPISIF